MYHSDALPEQRSSRPLVMPFVVELSGIYNEDTLRLHVPEYRVVLTTEIDRHDPIVSEANLVRVLVDTDDRMIEFLYVAHRRLPRKWEALRAIRVTTLSSLPDEIKYHEGPSLVEGRT